MNQEELMDPTVVLLDVTESVEGGYEARAIGHSIFTQGITGTI